jgi:hypothetical protein
VEFSDLAAIIDMYTIPSHDLALDEVIDCHRSTDNLGYTGLSIFGQPGQDVGCPLVDVD